MTKKWKVKDDNTVGWSSRPREPTASNRERQRHWWSAQKFGRSHWRAPEAPSACVEAPEGTRLMKSLRLGVVPGADGQIRLAWEPRQAPALFKTLLHVCIIYICHIDITSHITKGIIIDMFSSGSFFRHAVLFTAKTTLSIRGRVENRKCLLDPTTGFA